MHFHTSWKPEALSGEFSSKMGGSFSDLGSHWLGCSIEAEGLQAAAVLELKQSRFASPTVRLGRSSVGFKSPSIFLSDRRLDLCFELLSLTSPMGEEIGEPLFLGAFRAGR